MADIPAPVLSFDGQCPDCGRRQIPPRLAPPEIGDDFDWLARDYDRIRIAMLEELAARFPERTRWTDADLEVVLTEVLATHLDQLSDMADRVSAEAYLESARRPESVRRLLALVGYDSVALSEIPLEDDPPELPQARTAVQKLEQLWTNEPVLMERARRAGPRTVHNQRRLVTLEDYTTRLEEHPVVRRAAARLAWTGAWTTLEVAVVLRWPKARLDEAAERYLDAETRAAVESFHRKRSLAVPEWASTPPPTLRMVLEPFLNGYRMVGQEVVLEDAVPVGVVMDLTIDVGQSYFQSEVRRAVADALGAQPGGLFEPGRHRFGEDLHAGDIFQTLLHLEGVLNVCLTRFKRVGNQYPDFSVEGLIRLDGLEIAVCDNDPNDRQRGFYRLLLRGGRKG